MGLSGETQPQRLLLLAMLTSDCREESLAFCYGDGANGKGTFMNTFAWMLGDYADDLPFSAFEMHSRAGMVEGEILSRKFIDELLALVDSGESDDATRLMAERERLRGEIENLVKSVAVGIPAETVAPAIREREEQIGRLEVRLRAPRLIAPNIEKLRDAPLQRVEEWRITLRAEPRVARLLLRRLVEPLVLHDESTRPDFIKAEAPAKPALLDGLICEIPGLG